MSLYLSLIHIFLTFMNANRFQITVNRDVGTMTDQHVPHATITEDGTHLTIVEMCIKDRFRAFSSCDVWQVDFSYPYE